MAGVESEGKWSRGVVAVSLSTLSPHIPTGSDVTTPIECAGVVTLTWTHVPASWLWNSSTGLAYSLHFTQPVLMKLQVHFHYY